MDTGPSLPLVGRVGRRQPAGVGGLQGRDNSVRDAFRILINVRIPEPQNTKPLRSKEFITQSISVRLTFHRVLTSISFDNQPAAKTDEIDNVAANRCLAAKVKAERLHIAKPRP